MHKMLCVTTAMLIFAVGVKAMGNVAMERAYIYLEKTCGARTHYTSMEACLLRWSGLGRYYPVNRKEASGRQTAQPDTVIDYFAKVDDYGASAETQSLFRQEDGGWSLHARYWSELPITVFALGAAVREKLQTDSVSKSVAYVLERYREQNGWGGFVRGEPSETSLSLMVMVFEALLLSRQRDVLLSRQDRAMLERLADALETALSKQNVEAQKTLMPSTVALYVCGLNHLKYGVREPWVTWLETHQNEDGGWGDSVNGVSELLTTCYVIMALEGWARECLPDEDVLLSGFKFDSEGMVVLEHGEDLRLPWEGEKGELIRMSLIDERGVCVQSCETQDGSQLVCPISSLTGRTYEVVITDWSSDYGTLRGERSFTLKLATWHTISQLDFHGWNADGVFYAGRPVELSPLITIHCHGNEAAEGTLTGGIRTADGTVVCSFEPVKVPMSAGYVALGTSLPKTSVIFDKSGAYVFNVSFVLGTETCEKTFSFTVQEPRVLTCENRLAPVSLKTGQTAAKVILKVSLWNPDSDDALPVSFADVTIQELQDNVRNIRIDKLVNGNGQLIQDGHLIVQTEFGTCSGKQKLVQGDTLLTYHPIKDGTCEFQYHAEQYDVSTGALLRFHSGTLEGQNLHLKAHIGNVFVPLAGRDPTYEEVPF